MKILTTQHICSPLYHGILSPDEIPNTKRSMKVKVFLSFLGYWIPYTKYAAIKQENAKVMSVLSSSIISTQLSTSDVFDAWSRPSLQSWRMIHCCIAGGSYKHKFKHTSLIQYNIRLSVGILQNIDEAFRMHSDDSLQWMPYRLM